MQEQIRLGSSMQGTQSLKSLRRCFAEAPNDYPHAPLHILHTLHASKATTPSYHAMEILIILKGSSLFGRIVVHPSPSLRRFLFQSPRPPMLN